MAVFLSKKYDNFLSSYYILLSLKLVNVVAHLTFFLFNKKPVHFESNHALGEKFAPLEPYYYVVVPDIVKVPSFRSGVRRKYEKFSD